MPAATRRDTPPGCPLPSPYRKPGDGGPYGVPVFPGCQKYAGPPGVWACPALFGFLRQPRRAVSAGCHPAIVRQGIRKKRKEETRSPAAPGNAPLPERPI